MNILIIGGLLLLVVVAIVGLTMLSMEEARTEQQRKADAAPPLPQTPPSEALQAQATPTAPSVAAQPSHLPGAPLTLPSREPNAIRQLSPSPREQQHSLVPRSDEATPHEETAETTSHEQLQDIAEELHNLTQKAREMRQRLNRLTAIVERQQFPQNTAAVRPSIAEGREEA